MAERQIVKLMETVRDNLAGGWPGNTDAQVETWLLGTTTQQNDISWDQLMTWLATVSGFEKLEVGTQTGSTANVKGASAYIDVSARAGNGLRLSDPAVRTFLANTVPEVFSTSDRDVLLAVSDVSVTRAVFYGVPRGLGHIERARALS